MDVEGSSRGSTAVLPAFARGVGKCMKMLWIAGNPT
jgi:hypothetical protein